MTFAMIASSDDRIFSLRVLHTYDITQMDNTSPELYGATWSLNFNNFYATQGSALW